MDLRIAVSAHRPELQNLERFSILPEAFLTEKYGALGSPLNRRGDQREHRSKEKQCGGTANNVHGPLDSQLEFLPFFPARQLGIERDICGVILIGFAHLLGEKVEGKGAAG